MTVSATNARSGPYVGNGATTDFPFDFEAVTADEVAVRVDGAVQGTGYEVTLAAEGGTVAFDVAPANGAEIYILSDPSFEQEVSFTNAGRFLPESHDEGLDRGAVRDIWLKDRVDRLISDDMLLDADSGGAFFALDAQRRPVFSSGTGADAGLRQDIAAENGGILVGYGPRDIDAKLDDMFSVLDIEGVTGDGSDDPSALPLGLIAARDAGVRWAWFPRGDYLTDRMISVWPMNLVGGGLGGAATITATEEMDAVIYDGGQNMEIKGLFIDGANLAKTGISLFNVNTGIVEDCLIQNCLLDGVELSLTGNDNNFTFQRNLVRFCGKLTAGTCSTTGSTITWTGVDLTTLDPPIRPKYDGVRVGVGGTRYACYTILSFTATSITVSEPIGANAAGTACAILQGNGLLIPPSGDSNIALVQKCTFKDIVFCGVRDISLYGAKCDNDYEGCEAGRSIGISAVHSPIGATEEGYFEGNRSTEIWAEQASGGSLVPGQLPVGIPVDVLVRDAARVNGMDMRYAGGRFQGDVTMLQNSTVAVDLAFGGVYVVHQNAAVGARTLNLPAMTSGLNTRRIAGQMRSEIVIFMEVLNGQTITLDAPESDINGAATKTNSTDYVAWTCQYCDTLGKWLVR